MSYNLFLSNFWHLTWYTIHGLSNHFLLYTLSFSTNVLAKPLRRRSVLLYLRSNSLVEVRRGRIQKANCFFLSGKGQKLHELLMNKKDEMLSDLIAYSMNFTCVPPGVCVTRFKNLCFTWSICSLTLRFDNCSNSKSDRHSTKNTSPNNRVHNNAPFIIFRYFGVRQRR